MKEFEEGFASSQSPKKPEAKVGFAAIQEMARLQEAEDQGDLLKGIFILFIKRAGIEPITLPFKMFGPFWSVWCKMALAEVGVSLP